MRMKTALIVTAAALTAFRSSPGLDFFAVRESDLRKWPEPARAGLVELGKFGGYRLLRESPR